MGWKRKRMAHETSLLLAASANGRYFVNAFDEPVYLNIDTCWSLMVQLTLAQVETYFADCQTRGFNGVICNAIEHFYGDNVPENTNGDLPFTGTPFQSSLNDDYWDHVEAVIALAAEYGIVLLINIAYIGFIGSGAGAEGWKGELAAADNSELQTYGANVGARFVNHDNIIIHDYGDFGPGSPSDNQMAQIHTGYISTDSRHELFSHHFAPSVSAHTDPQSYLTYAAVYQTNGFPHSDVLDAYAENIGPVLFFEGRYELESGSALDQRRQPWNALLSGALAGAAYGHRDIWRAQTSGTPDAWVSALDDTGRAQQAHVKTFVDAHPFHLLEPDTTSTFVTAGRGTLGTAGYVVAAFASDNSFGAAYLPTGSTGGAITVDRSEFDGPFSWTWYNTRTGGTSGGASGVSNTSTQQFTAPDTDDWVWVGTVD